MHRSRLFEAEPRHKKGEPLLFVDGRFAKFEKSLQAAKLKGVDFLELDKFMADTRKWIDDGSEHGLLRARVLFSELQDQLHKIMVVSKHNYNQAENLLAQVDQMRKGRGV